MYLQLEGCRLHYDIVGEGEPLLWLHGGMGCGSDWRYLFDGPPPGYEVIAPDLRGHGASIDESGRFTFRQCALDVLALLDHLGLARVKAIGLSGGGLVLLHLATLRRDAVSSMVLVSAPPYFPAEARAAMRGLSEAMLGVAEMTRMRERHQGGEAQIQYLLATMRGLADSYDDVNFTPPYLGTIEAETLVVFGDRDPLYPVTLGVELYRAIPRAYLWVVPNGGHGPIFGEAREAFLRTAVAFLGGRLGGPAATP